MRERRSLTLSIWLCLCLLIFSSPTASASDVQEARPAQDPSPTPIAKVEPLQDREGRPPDQRSQHIIFSDDFGQRVPQSRFHLDRALNVPDWLHLGLQSRWRYESYSQPLRKTKLPVERNFRNRRWLNSAYGTNRSCCLPSFSTPARSITSVSRSTVRWKTVTMCCNSISASGRTVSSGPTSRPSCGWENSLWILGAAA